MSVMRAAEAGWLPDATIRFGIRRLLRQRLREEHALPPAARAARVEALRDSAVATHTATANDQHYEVPTEFFRLVLGPHLKYSASIFPDGATSLAAAEAHTLQLYLQRADVRSGHRVLDLGCGWGSLTLWLAEREPACQVTAVSNSSTQRAFIECRAAELGLSNVTVITCDINQLDFADASFDRVISVEMFEHVRNYQQLLGAISGWLAPRGKLLVHVFCHRELLYPFEADGDDNWMGRYFFSGGQMPAADTLTHFQQHLRLEDSWQHSGVHYRKTARAWLDNLDGRRTDVARALTDAAAADQVGVWLQRWRMFFMACEETFGYSAGDEWRIGHYLFDNGGD